MSNRLHKNKTADLTEHLDVNCNSCTLTGLYENKTTEEPKKMLKVSPRPLFLLVRMEYENKTML